MNFDFDSIKTELKDRLSLLSNWITTLYYGVYDRILDVIAYITEKLAYLAEYYYTESGWSTATLHESIMHKLKMYNYTPYRKVGAIGTLSLSANSNFSSTYTYTGENVIIPRWTAFTNSNGTVFVYCTEETIYYKGTVGNQDIPVKEGIYTEYTHIAEGVANEEITLYVPNIDNTEIEVLIVNSSGETLYTVRICGTGSYENDLYLIDDTDNYYCQIENLYDFQGIKITFGNEINTKKLDAEMRILIKYGATNGNDGNITSSGVITVISDTLTDANEDEVTLYVTNEEEISDGSDIESLTSIKTNAPNLYQTGYRAGSLYDWDAILESLSYINKSQVWSAYDIGDETTENQNKVYVTAVSSDGTDLTTTQKEDITETIKEYKSPTEIITFQDLKKIYILFDIAAVITNQPYTVVDEIIYEELDDNYGVLNVSFQTNVYESNYISIIDNLSEIIHHQTTAAYLEKNLASSTSEHALTPCIITGDEEDQIWLTSGSAKLWIQRKVGGVWLSGAVQIGQELSGSIYGMNGYTINNVLINRSNNEISFTVVEITSGEYGTQNPGSSTDDGYIISLSYTTQDGYGDQTTDIRLGDKANITDIDEDFIFTDYEYE